MPQRALPLSLVLLCCLPALLAAESVRGYVVEATSGKRLPGVEVAFYVRQESQVSEVLRRSTDEEGRFAFSGPFLQPGLEFALAAFYQGVPHSTSTLVVGEQRQIILEVYESTADASHLRIPAHNLFLTLTETRLEVAHLVQVENSGEHTYAGSVQGNQRRVTEFALPAGAFNVQSQAERLQRADPTRYFDNQPLEPGLSQITFTFSLDPRQLEDGYAQPILYPTERLEIFLQPASLQPGAPFADLGVVDLHGNQYRRLLLQDLSPGQRVFVPLPLARPLRWLLKWAALGAALVAGALCLWLSRAPPPSARAPDPETLRRQLDGLLSQVARLDEGNGGGEDAQHYRAERRQLMDRALVLARLLEESGLGR